MADVVKIAESKIQELADAVRTYVGSSDSYTLADMPDAINPRYVYIYLAVILFGMELLKYHLQQPLGQI